MESLTIVDIARLAGVSVSTASRVLNKHPDVSKATYQKVMKVIEEHGYVPNNSARSLKRTSMKAVAVIMKGFSNPIFTAMLNIIQRELDQSGYTMLLSQIDPNHDEVMAAISICKEKKPKGIIFMGGNFTHSRDNLAMLNVPFIMLTMTMHKDVDRKSFSSVTIDDRLAGYAVAKEIYQNGHKKFAIIGANENDISVSKLRIDGFCKYLKEQGLNWNVQNIEYAGGFTYRAGYEAAKKLLSKAEFTCIFCVADILALGAIRAIADADLSVPGDISVIGFDGIEEGQFFIPSLATMKQPEDEMAHRCVKILLNHIRKGAAHRHELFEAPFYPGESFAPLTVK